jgi:hypothetical protein
MHNTDSRGSAGAEAIWLQHRNTAAQHTIVHTTSEQTVSFTAMPQPDRAKEISVLLVQPVGMLLRAAWYIVLPSDITHNATATGGTRNKEQVKDMFARSGSSAAGAAAARAPPNQYTPRPLCQHANRHRIHAV